VTSDAHLGSTTGNDPGYDVELMAAVTELGSALRALVDASVRTTLPAADLREAAAGTRALADRLASCTRPVEQLPELDDVLTFRRVYNPVSGVGSALAPPLELRLADPARPAAGTIGTLSLGQAYEGPPGYAHGGMSALLLDQLLGATAIAAGLWGMTVRLETDYRRPVPLRTPLELRARVVEDAGRRTVVHGTIAAAADPGTVLVEGRGVFVMPRAERLAGYFGGVTDASGRPSPPTRPTDATAVRQD
jgi:acyl-coenzyme A thioesterase PaaI-like protein